MFDALKKKNILVLGNNGMLGHDVYEKLVELSSKRYSTIGTVIGVDVEDNIDLTKRHALGNYMDEAIHFDYCINCVAYTDTKSAETTESGKTLDYKLNALAPKYIAESCKAHKTKLIHISTDYVFSEKSANAVNASGHVPTTMFVPLHEPFPVNNYGIHKLLGEKFIEEEFGKGSKDYSILRVSWLYGAWNSKSFIHKFLRNATVKFYENPNLELTMTENEVSVPTSTEFVCDCIKDVIDNNKHGMFHAVPSVENNGVSRLEFAQTILDMWSELDSTKDITFNNKALNAIKLVPVKHDGYQPKYSAMLNNGIGYATMSWKDDLRRFLDANGFKLLSANDRK